jgi:quinol monooxygenase YgiN
MHIQVVTFRLQDLSDTDYVAGCERDAPAFAAVPGLLSKIWLRDPATGTYGGVKTWADRQAMEDYLKGDVWRALVGSPHFVDAESRDFGVIEAPTRITRGYQVVPS